MTLRAPSSLARLSHIDTMYKKRALTAGSPTTMPKAAFRALIQRAPGLLREGMTDTDYIFMRNLGFTDPKHPKFELRFEHFLDALQDMAGARYPMEQSAENALLLLIANHIRPLYIELFGHESAPSSPRFSHTMPDSDGRSTTSRSECGAVSPRGELSIWRLPRRFPLLAKPPLHLCFVAAPLATPVLGVHLPYASVGPLSSLCSVSSNEPRNRHRAYAERERTRCGGNGRAALARRGYHRRDVGSERGDYGRVV